MAELGQALNDCCNHCGGWGGEFNRICKSCKGTGKIESQENKIDNAADFKNDIKKDD